MVSRAPRPARVVVDLAQRGTGADLLRRVWAGAATATRSWCRPLSRENRPLDQFAQVSRQTPELKGQTTPWNSENYPTG